nr:Ycf37 [Erythrotrichia foliiformis]
MTQLLSTTYLFILLSFLILISYYISSEILKNIQEENIFNLPGQIYEKGEDLDELMHLSLIKLYSKRSITDAALYEIEFLLKSAKHSYSSVVISNLYGLMGEKLETIEDNRSAIKAYSTAKTVSKNNQKAKQNLKRLVEKEKRSNSD